MPRKDTRSPGPQHECHLQFNCKSNSIKQKLSRRKKGGAAATFRHLFNLAEALTKEMVN